MKRCPSCNQTFDEEWLSFCTQDGTTLLEDSGSAGDPPPTILASPPALPQPGPANLNLPAAEYGAPARPYIEPSEPVWKPPPPPPYAQPQSNGLALAAMIVGIASLLCFGVFPGIVAIILGLMALSNMKKSPEHTGGQSQAWTGVITGGLGVLIHGAVLIFYIIAIAISAANQ